MCIGKAHALFRELIEVRSGNFTGWIIGFQVAVAEVIGVEDDDVKLRRFCACDEFANKGDGEKGNSSDIHD